MCWVEILEEFLETYLVEFLEEFLVEYLKKTSGVLERIHVGIPVQTYSGIPEGFPGGTAKEFSCQCHVKMSVEISGGILSKFHGGITGTIFDKYLKKSPVEF